jgi:hypothetical protein
MGTTGPFLGSDIQNTLIFHAPSRVGENMLGSLSLAPGLAVASVTTSVSLAAAMGGAQSLPTEPAKPPIIRVAAADPTSTPAPTPTPTDTPAPAVVVAVAPVTTPPPPTDTPAPPTVVAHPAPPAAPAPAKTQAPPPPPPPANPQQCWNWSGDSWTLNYCTSGSGGTWTATGPNGSTYSGTGSSWATPKPTSSPYSGSSWGSGGGNQNGHH